MRLPTPTEPVKLIAFTSRCWMMPSPTTEPRPMTRLNTPAGMPLREMMSAIAHAQPGTRSAGLMTTQVAVRQRRCNLPRRNRDREIPRRDEANNTDRSASYLNANVGPHRRDRLTRQTQAFTGEEL